MLEKYKNPYAIELKGERSLITTSYEKVEKNMTETDPTELMKKHDEAIRIENALSGLSEDGTGVANPGKHYIQLIEARYPNNSFSMYANNYFTGYVGESIEDVLDIKKFTTDGWGPWHEVGHQHQQIPGYGVGLER